MAEVTATLAPALDEPSCGRCCRSSVGRARSSEIADKLVPGSRSTRRERERASAALAAEAARRYSAGRAWREGVIAAAQGRLDALPHPAPPADNVPAP